MTTPTTLEQQIAAAVDLLTSHGHVVTPPAKKERRECIAIYDASVLVPWVKIVPRGSGVSLTVANEELLVMREVWPGDVTLSAEEHADLVAKAERAPRFKVGDRVKLKPGRSEEAPSKVFTVRRLGGVQVTSEWFAWYSEDDLELIEAAP